MAPDPLPEWVYKIIPTAPPQPIPAQYPLSDLDAKDGFVHLSSSSQVPNTANLFYNDASNLWVIKLEYIRFTDSIKWENGFPHLYGNFGKDDVDSVQTFKREEGQTWPDAMSGSTWLQ